MCMCAVHLSRRILHCMCARFQGPFLPPPRPPPQTKKLVLYMLTTVHTLYMCICALMQLDAMVSIFLHTPPLMAYNSCMNIYMYDHSVHPPCTHICMIHTQVQVYCTLYTCIGMFRPRLHLYIFVHLYRYV